MQQGQVWWLPLITLATASDVHPEVDARPPRATPCRAPRRPAPPSTAGPRRRLRQGRPGDRVARIQRGRDQDTRRRECSCHEAAGANNPAPAASVSHGAAGRPGSQRRACGRRPSLTRVRQDVGHEPLDALLHVVVRLGGGLHPPDEAVLCSREGDGEEEEEEAEGTRGGTERHAPLMAPSPWSIQHGLAKHAT
jgi:hypothetical protein